MTPPGPRKDRKSPRSPLTYAGAGVDLERYDAFVSTIPAMIRRTHGQRVIQNPGGFAGLFRLDYNEKLFKRNFKDPVLVAATDGVGTKIRLAQRLGVYDTIGIDLVAMSVNDLIVEGAEPLLFLDYLAANAVDPAVMRDILSGIAAGCRTAGAALIGGETAEMGDLYAPGDFDLAGFAVGVVELRRAIGRQRVSPGDIVLGLASSGVHSNGYSLVRRIIDDAGLDLDEPCPWAGADTDGQGPPTLGRALLEPTRIYAPSIVRVQRGYAVKNVITAMAHITGGGLDQNLERALPSDVDAVLSRRAWEVPPIFRLLQERGGVEDQEMQRVFNMGIGYVLVVRPTFADAVARKLRRMGETVFMLGETRKGAGKVRWGRS